MSTSPCLLDTSAFDSLQSLGRRYVVRAFHDASSVSSNMRRDLMAALNRIIAMNWRVTEPHWTEASSPFRQDFGLVLVEFDDSLVAFSVYRRLLLGGIPTIYRCGTEVLPQHQGRGLYGFFTGAILGAMRSAYGAPVDRIRYSWRTRNPIVWAANAKLCEKVVPSLLGDSPDAVLQAACAELGLILYPDKPLEAPTMIMRGAYGHIRHRPQRYHGMASLVATTLERLIPNPADAFLSLGTVRLSSLASEQRTT